MRDLYMFTIVVNGMYFRGKRYFPTHERAERAMVKFLDRFAREFGQHVSGFVHMT